MILTETGNSSTPGSHPEPVTIPEFIHPDETLAVTCFDQLAGSLRDLRTIAVRIRERDAHLAATEQPVGTSTAVSKAFCEILGVFVPFETNLSREREAERVGPAFGGLRKTRTLPAVA